MSFRRCDWLFPPSAREVSPGNRSNYKSTRERVGSEGLYGRWRLHLMGSCFNVFPSFVESLPDFRRFLMILYNTPSHCCCGFSLSCTQLDLREARVKKSAFISVMKIVALNITGVFVVDAHPVSEMGCCSVIFVVQL